MTNTPQVRQLRLVVEVADFDDAVSFYRDVLGLREALAFAEGGDDRVAILEAGRATLEFTTGAHARAIDRHEGVTTPGPRIRLALEVDDSARATAVAVEAGAPLIAPPTQTPWRSLNSRLDAPGGLQLTLFEELATLEERAASEGFGTDADRPGAAS